MPKPILWFLMLIRQPKASQEAKHIARCVIFGNHRTSYDRQMRDEALKVWFDRNPGRLDTWCSQYGDRSLQ